MKNDSSKKPVWTSRTIAEAFSSTATAVEAGRQYVMARHHHVEKPKHALDYERVYVNLGPRDNGQAPAMVLA